jgi:hypothetical protein
MRRNDDDDDYIGTKEREKEKKESPFPLNIGDLRDYLVGTPGGNAQYSIRVRAPHGPGSHDGEVPQHDISLSVTRGEALVASNERNGVHLGLVATEDRFRTCRG